MLSKVRVAVLVVMTVCALVNLWIVHENLERFKRVREMEERLERLGCGGHVG